MWITSFLLSPKFRSNGLVCSFGTWAHRRTVLKCHKSKLETTPPYLSLPSGCLSRVVTHSAANLHIQSLTKTRVWQAQKFDGSENSRDKTQSRIFSFDQTRPCQHALTSSFPRRRYIADKNAQVLRFSGSDVWCLVEPVHYDLILKSM